MTFDRRAFLAGSSAAAAVFLAGGAGAEPGAAAVAGVEPWAARLLDAAEAQVGVTTIYDPAYVRLAYPGGDVPPERGVCTDVIIRAYRAAFGVDLQKRVHEDMGAAWADYPRTWGAKLPDRNIDHRRVPNLEAFFRRHVGALSTERDAALYRPGDIVTQRLPGALPHIAIVTAKRSDNGARPLVVHNIGRGALIEDTLFGFPLAGHFRFPPDA